MGLCWKKAEKKEEKIMPSAKQIAWRKKFARMSKAGKFKDKKSKSTKCTVCLFGMSHEEAIKHGFIQS